MVKNLKRSVWGQEEKFWAVRERYQAAKKRDERERGLRRYEVGVTH